MLYKFYNIYGKDKHNLHHLAQSKDSTNRREVWCILHTLLKISAGEQNSCRNHLDLSFFSLGFNKDRPSDRIKRVVKNFSPNASCTFLRKGLQQVSFLHFVICDKCFDICTLLSSHFAPRFTLVNYLKLKHFLRDQPM